MKKFSLLLVGFLAVTSCAKSPEQIYEKNKDKVVKIGMVDDKGGHGSCSGAFIDKYGTVLTCAHCFSHQGIVKIFVKTEDETVYNAIVIKKDKEKDLALVSVIGVDGNFPWDYAGISFGSGIAPSNFPFFNFFRKPLKRGQQVLLFGSPLGIQHSMAVGYVENFKEEIGGMEHHIVINSAAINPGNSGGPLVDLHGNLIGIGEGSIMANPFVPADGLGFAIDVTTIKSFLEEK